MNNQDAIKRFRQRRSARLGFETIKHYDSVKEYRKRRAERLAARMDADGDDDSAPAPKKGGGGHGNTKLPFGLCQREGIDIQPGWTPQDAWKALEGKGYSAGEAYKELKETGKVSKKEGVSQKGGSDKSAQKATTGKKDYSAMDYDSLAKEYEDHNRRYREAEDKYKNKGKNIKTIKSMVDRIKSMKERGDYHGETYEELEKGVSIDPTDLDGEGFTKYYNQHFAKKAMDMFGRDVFSKSDAEIERMAATQVEEIENIGFGELNEERVAIQEAMSKKAKEKYPNISDCDSPIALEARMRGDDYFVAGHLTSVTMSYDTLDPKTVGGIGKAMDGIKAMFPELSGKLQPFLVNDSPAENAYAHCELSSWSDAQVVLSRNKFKNGAAMQETLKNDVKNGFHPRGTASFEAVVTHEYGHAIDDYLTKTYKEELKEKRFCEYVLDRLRESHPREDVTGIMRKVSAYAVNNKSPHGMEFLAEALSEYCCAKKPRPIAMEVGEIMKEFIQNPKSALEPRKPKTSDWGWAPPDDDDEEVPLF